MYYFESHNRILQFRNNSDGSYFSTFQAIESLFVVSVQNSSKTLDVGQEEC